MSKASDLNRARLQGMAYALNVIREKGIEEFEKELAWRARIQVTAAISPQELLEDQKHIKTGYEMITRIMAINVLHDEFDFDREAVRRFVDRWNVKTECLIENYVSWLDYISLAEEITGDKYEVEYK